MSGDFNIIWKNESGNIFTLVDSESYRVTVTPHEVDEDEYEEITVYSELETMQPGKHYVVSVENLSNVLGWS